MSPVFLTGRGDFCIINLPGGAVAQLGEYVTGSHGVAGSSPVSSTIKILLNFCLINQNLNICRHCETTSGP